MPGNERVTRLPYTFPGIDVPEAVMRFRIAVALAIGTAFTFTSGATFAHHSFAAEFDNRIPVTLHGEIASVEIVNPHSFIYIDVESDGAVEQWALEGPGPHQVRRRQGKCGLVTSDRIRPRHLASGQPTNLSSRESSLLRVL